MVTPLLVGFVCVTPPVMLGKAEERKPEVAVPDPVGAEEPPVGDEPAAVLALPAAGLEELCAIAGRASEARAAMMVRRIFVLWLGD